ncbi:hypothetical protein M422DRAFT_266117 [Sphaerobolus stellatus SS14]|uniref:Unplaced genomic scaffold SPHSTscaffold_156, whole genome shotgun sequence n=1 Tax=Sphaerobolus stellatus (strain SS14) TaxID=990650 RepID=A0A0C9UBZ8_SPHS4|nr:hypothetical protein M422DRAFT_266117 [Sphaerobolus stellatus SS14]
MSRYDASPSILFPSLISRIGVIPVAERRKLYTGRVDPHLTFVAEVCIDVDNAALQTLENVQHLHPSTVPRYGHYAILRTSSDKQPLFCNLALQEWMTMSAAESPSWLGDLILALHLLPVPVSLSPTTLDVSHIEGVRKALRASMSKSLTDAITKSDKLLLLQDRREWNKDGTISTNTCRLMSRQNALT